MEDLTIPIIGLITLGGYFFSKKGKDTRQLEVKDDKIEEFEKPTGTNIYTSNRVNEINQELLDKSFSNYDKSLRPSETGILPPLFNTYGISGSDILLNTNTKQITAKQQKELNDINKLKDITVKDNIKIEDRPMFKKKNYEGTERTDNNYYQIGGDIDEKISLLTGLPLNNEHANMVPFFGSNTKQNMEQFANVSLLDKYTGSRDLFQHKKESGQLFDNVKQDIYSTTFNTSTDRYIPSMYRQNEKVVQEERISAPIAGTFTNNIKPVFKDVNDLNVKQKETFDARQNSGKFGEVRGVSGIVEKQRPDTFYEKNQDHLFKTPGSYLAPNMQENYTNFKPTNRKEYNTEYYGVANSSNQATKQRITRENNNNMDSIFEESTRQNYENDYTRNISGVKSTNDFGKSSFNLYETERTTTGLEDDAFKLNANKSNLGNTTRLQDLPKETLKETMLSFDNSGNIKTRFDKGISSAYNSGINVVNAKTTHKETTIMNDYNGNVVKNEGMGYLVNKYDAKTTGKEIITNNSEYSGIINSKDKQSYIKTTFENPEKVRNANHARDYQGIANPTNETFLSRNNYLNAETRDNREVSLSGNRASGPQNFQINKGKDSFGEYKVSSNTLFKEREETRDHLNVNQLQNITSKNIQGIQTKVQLNNNQIINDRLEPSLVYSQHNANPYSLKKM